MSRQWIRLDTGYMMDGKLARAGWEAALIWPAVICRVKERGGVCDPEDLDPLLLHRLTGAPVEMIDRSLDSLARVGLLVWGSYRMRGGKGGSTDVEGVVIPGWRRFNPDDGPTTVISEWKRSPGNGGIADVARSFADFCGASDRYPETAGRDGRDGTNEKNGTIPPKPPQGGALVLPGLEPDQDDPDPQPSGPSDLEVVWAEYRGLQIGQGIRRGEKVTKDLRRPIKARLKESGLEAVLKVIRWAHTSNHERARMLRDGGYLGATLFRASKFPEYLSMAGGSGANGNGQRRNEPDHDPDDSDEWVDPAHRPKRWADPWDNPRDWTESLRDRLREFVDRGELPDPEDEDLCWAQYGMGVQAYRWFHGVDPWRGTADDSPARRFRLKDLMGNWVWRRQHQDGPPVVEALAAHLEEQGLDLPDLDVQRQVAAQLLRSLRVDPAEHGLGEVGR